MGCSLFAAAWKTAVKKKQNTRNILERQGKDFMMGRAQDSFTKLGSIRSSNVTIVVARRELAAALPSQTNKCFSGRDL